MSTRPRLYRRASIDLGDVIGYLIVSTSLAFLTVHVLLAIGEGRF